MPAHLSTPLQRPAALFAAGFLLLLSALAGAGGSIVLATATRVKGPSSNGETPIAFPSVPQATVLTIVYGMAYFGLFLASAGGILAIALRRRRLVAFYAAAIAFEYLVSTALGAAAIGTLYRNSNHAAAIQSCASALTGVPSDLIRTGQTLTQLPKFAIGAVQVAMQRCNHAYSTIQALVLALWITTRVVEPLALLAIMAYRRTLPAHADARNMPFDPEQGTLPGYACDKAGDTETLPEYTPGAYDSHAVDEKDFDLAEDDDAESPWGAAGDSSMVDIDLMAEAAAGEESQYTSPNEGFKVFYVNMAHHHRPRPRPSKVTPHTVFTRHAQSMERGDADFPEHMYPARGHRPTASVPNAHPPPSSFKKHKATQSHSSGLDGRVLAEPVAYDEESDPEAMSADDDVPGGTYASMAQDEHGTLGIPAAYTYRAASHGAGAGQGLRAVSPEHGNGRQPGARRSHESDHSTRSSDSERTIVVTCRVGDEGEDDGKDNV